MVERFTEWVSQHGGGWLSVVAASSLILLLATPVVLPWWVSTLPEDYFVRARRPHRSAWDIARAALATLVGGLLVGAGIAMLVLPGQGLLTVFVGLSLMHFPGKRKLQRSVLRQPRVARALQWMRRRAGRAPMQLPEPRR